MKIRNQKGESEILSYIIVILIVVGIVGMISAGILPAIEKAGSQRNFQESKQYIQEINLTIKEVLENPVGSTTSLIIDLENLFLEISQEEQKIEVFHYISGNYYQEGMLVTEGNIYTFREMDKLIVGLDVNGYEIIGDLDLTNTKTTIYFKKIDRSKIQISRDIDSTQIVNIERERP